MRSMPGTDLAKKQRSEGMTPNERVKILRILHGYTQQSLSEALGVWPSFVAAWEEYDGPACEEAKSLAFRFGVSKEYLLRGENPPLAALWKLVYPSPPESLLSVAIGINEGLPALFKELGITLAIKGESSTGNYFMLCGNSPECSVWRMDFLVHYEQPLHQPVMAATGQGSGITVMEMDFAGGYDTQEMFILDASDFLGRVYHRPLDCRLLLEKCSEITEDVTLAGLLKQPDKMLQSQKATFKERELDILSNFIGREIVKRTRSEGAGLAAG